MAERRAVHHAEESAADRQRLPAVEAGQLGLQQINELTGKDPEGVSGVEPLDDDGWRVTVEVVEDRRIPSSTDLLATYQVELDPDGELLAYRRVRRYARGRGDSDGDM
jgi:Gas vesicle synthesis protein GvpO